MPTTYWVTDGEGPSYEYEGTPRDVAQRYIDDTGDWLAPAAMTQWVDVYISETKESDYIERISIAVHPDPPPCTDPHNHTWATPHSIVGGCVENPGVWGSGGGTRGTDVCLLCGCARHWNNWAQRPDTGEQGLDSIQYYDGAYDSEIIDQDDKTAIVEIEGECLAVDLQSGKYRVMLDDDEITIRGTSYKVVRYEQFSYRWEEIDDETQD